MTAEELEAKELELAQKEQQLTKKEQELAVREQELAEKIKAGVDPDALQTAVAEQLQPIKEKLDKAYTARDEALAKVAEFERKEKEADLQRLKDEGKHQEAYELEKATLKAEKEALEKRNIELTRDIDVRSALSNFTFRNEKALKTAHQEIIGELVKDDKGVWTHKTGISIDSFVKSFCEDEDNAYLLKQIASSGAELKGVKKAADPGSKAPSLFGKTQAEVLAMAAKGQLPNQKR